MGVASAISRRYNLTGFLRSFRLCSSVTSFVFFLYLKCHRYCSVCVCVDRCMPWRPCGGQRSTFESLLSFHLAEAAPLSFLFLCVLRSSWLSSSQKTSYPCLPSHYISTGVTASCPPRTASYVGSKETWQSFHLLSYSQSSAFSLSWSLTTLLWLVSNYWAQATFLLQYSCVSCRSARTTGQTPLLRGS